MSYSDEIGLEIVEKYKAFFPKQSFKEWLSNMDYFICQIEQD